VAYLLYDGVTSPLGRSVLKCSLAYVLGSLATLVPAISGLLGHNDGKHMVATVVTYFHPARNAGSMIEACLLATLAFLYAVVISFASMGVSVFFGAHDLLTLGHVVVLVVFCGGGLGLVGWTKQRLGNPLVNVACSLTSLAIITVLTKEGSVQAAKFSYEKVVQVLKMILMGVFASCLVSFLITPRSARKDLRDDLVRITDLQEEVLTFITRGFLSGSDEDCNDEVFAAAQKRYNRNFNSMVRNLREARFEHYFLGNERVYELEVKLVKCIERLAQDLVGLRSAASTQFALISKSEETRLHEDSSLLFSPSQMSDSGMNSRATITGLESILEVSEDNTPYSEDGHGNDGSSSAFGSMSLSAADIFSLFISQLGPPMKSLAFTLKGVLNDLPFGPPPKYEITFSGNFIRSLTDAKDLFISARREALNTLYNHRITLRERSIDVDADYEEVAASCGHFSSSLEDFAEDTIVYLKILQELKAVLTEKPFKRSWKWMQFWRSRSPPSKEAHEDEEALLQTENENVSRRIPSPGHFVRPQQHKLVRYQHNTSLSYRIYRGTSILRREDVKYAIKVGLGAMIYAMFSFIPSTRPIYARWRGEWGLVSYMLVCSMTIGASNTTGLQRFIGTCIGAVFAIFAWIVSNGNPIALGFLGWIVALGCFGIILVLGKGPMGRFILLTYNLSALYAYSLSVREGEDDDDEGGASPEIWGIVVHRVVAVLAGCIWGIIVTRLIWPISARKKVKNGISLLWLRMGLIWKRDPLQMLLDGPSGSSYMDIRESIDLRRFLAQLESLRASAAHEFDLRGPFPDKTYREILEATGRMLGAFHAMQVIITKDLKANTGELELLKYTKGERIQLSARISHLFSGNYYYLGIRFSLLIITV
jgi:Fusaric acid resistance protein-like